MRKIISDYLDRVCALIRSKTLSHAVRDELASHIRERCAGLLAEGLSEEDAARRAVELMGSPEELAAKIKLANHSTRDVLILCGGAFLAIISIIGVMMLTTLSVTSIAGFLDMASFLFVCALGSGIALISSAKGLSALLFWQNLRRSSILAGAVGSVIGMIVTLSNLDSFELLGVNLAVSLICLFYGLLLSAVAAAAAHWLSPPNIAGIVREL